jgi:hypothetical protein
MDIDPLSPRIKDLEGSDVYENYKEIIKLKDFITYSQDNCNFD